MARTPVENKAGEEIVLVAAGMEAVRLAVPRVEEAGEVEVWAAAMLVVVASGEGG